MQMLDLGVRLELHLIHAPLYEVGNSKSVIKATHILCNPFNVCFSNRWIRTKQAAHVLQRLAITLIKTL